MKKELIRQIINQLKKYDLAEEFNDKDNLLSWINSLNTTQLNNFLSLNINPSYTNNIKDNIVCKELLNKSDFKERIQLLTNIKDNVDGCWNYLNETLTWKYFVNHKNYYKDIQALIDAEKARTILWAISKAEFLDSPYHDEDINLLLNVSKRPEDDRWLVSDSLAAVASNIESIKSPYHRQDMRLISNADKNCLQGSHTYPETSLNNLAQNENSLHDKYHLENMKILSKNPIGGKFLYKIMTDKSIINGKYYRQEVNALVHANSYRKAKALYYFIANPDDKFNIDRDDQEEYNQTLDRYSIERDNLVRGINNPNYLERLNELNTIPDNMVMHYVSLLMNPTISRSPYINEDLKYLKASKSSSMFLDIYNYIFEKKSQTSPHHLEDIKLLCMTANDLKRELLYRMATEENCFNNIHRNFDINFIINMNLESFYQQYRNKIDYYLFENKGINAKKHEEALLSLSQGIIPPEENKEYLAELEKELNNDQNITEISNNKKPKILSIFRRNKTSIK